MMPEKWFLAFFQEKMMLIRMTNNIKTAPFPSVFHFRNFGRKT